jgi:hypothetical protein
MTRTGTVAAAASSPVFQADSVFQADAIITSGLFGLLVGLAVDAVGLYVVRP